MTTETKNTVRQGKTPVKLDQTEAMQLLIDSGLLFEINRVVMHPLGYSIIAQVHDDEISLGMLTDNPTVTFDREVFKMGMKKRKRFLDEVGQAAMDLRRKLLGITVQHKPTLDEQRTR